MNQGLSSGIRGIAELYQNRILSIRTRRVSLAGRKCQPRLMYTFLGYELQMGRKRITCPDLSTARYLKIFGEIGMDSVQIPYDPTRTARLLPELERLFEELKSAVIAENPDRSRQTPAFRRTYRRLREALRRVSKVKE